MAHRQPFFKNPPKRKRVARKRRKAAAARRRATKRGADGKFMKSVTRKGRKVTRAAWSRSGYRRNPMARRLPGRSASGRFVKRRRASGSRRRRRNQPAALTLVNPRRRRRRNPPALSMKGIVGDVMEGLAGGAGVTAGKIATRQAVSMVKVDPGTWIGVGAQGLVGIAARTVLKRFLRGGLAGAFADGVAYGAFNAAFESGFRLLAPAQASKLLGEDYDGGDVPLAAYPDARLLMGYGAGQAAEIQERQQLYGW